MNDESDGPYVLTDRRCDGERRVLGQFREPRDATAALVALQRAGDTTATVEVRHATDPILAEAFSC